MAITLEIRIPDPVVERVRDALLKKFGYKDQILNPDRNEEGEPYYLPNPEGEKAFIERMLRLEIREMVLDVERREARKLEDDSNRESLEQEF